MIPDYLYHKDGSGDWYSITFDSKDEIKCNEPAPPMKASMSTKGYLSQPSFTMGKKFYCLFYRQLNLEVSGS